MNEQPEARMVLQRRLLSPDTPAQWRTWHDHPEPQVIAWGKGYFDTLEENMRSACATYYKLSPAVEYRMVRRTDETVWEYSAHAPVFPHEPTPAPIPPAL